MNYDKKGTGRDPRNPEDNTIERKQSYQTAHQQPPSYMKLDTYVSISLNKKEYNVKQQNTGDRYTTTHQTSYTK